MMGFEYIAYAAAYQAAIQQTTLTCNVGTNGGYLDIQDGDLIVAMVRWDNVDTTVSVMDGDDSSNSLTMQTISTANGRCGAMGDVIGAAAKVGSHPKATLGAPAYYLQMVVIQFRPEAGYTVNLDVDAVNSGTGTTVQTGNFSLTDNYSLVCNGVSLGSGGVTTYLASAKIGGYLRDGYKYVYSMTGIAYSELNKDYDDIYAQGTAIYNEPWLTNVLSFKMHKQIPSFADVRGFGVVNKGAPWLCLGTKSDMDLGDITFRGMPWYGVLPAAGSGSNPGRVLGGSVLGGFILGGSIVR